ncbi:MAG: hypothetical protein ACOC7R_05205, partial [Planctomycetota bacterium]
MRHTTLIVASIVAVAALGLTGQAAFGQYDPTSGYLYDGGTSTFEDPAFNYNYDDDMDGSNHPRSYWGTTPELDGDYSSDDGKVTGDTLRSEPLYLERVAAPAGAPSGSNYALRAQSDDVCANFATDGATWAQDQSGDAFGVGVRRVADPNDSEFRTPWIGIQDVTSYRSFGIVERAYVADPADWQDPGEDGLWGLGDLDGSSPGAAAFSVSAEYNHDDGGTVYPGFDATSYDALVADGQTPPSGTSSGDYFWVTSSGGSLVKVADITSAGWFTYSFSAYDDNGTGKAEIALVSGTDAPDPNTDTFISVDVGGASVTQGKTGIAHILWSDDPTPDGGWDPNTGTRVSGDGTPTADFIIDEHEFYWSVIPGDINIDGNVDVLNDGAALVSNLGTTSG